MTTYTGRQCSVCGHRRRAALEAEILNATPLMQIEKRFGVGRNSLQRHRDKHMRGEVEAAKAAREFEALERGGSVLERLGALDSRMAAIVDEAMALDDKSTAIRAIREVRGLIELRAKLTGELKDGGGSVTNITVNNTEFRNLQVAIVQALQPFPDAKAAVLRALRSDVGDQATAGPVVESEPN